MLGRERRQLSKGGFDEKLGRLLHERPLKTVAVEGGIMTGRDLITAAMGAVAATAFAVTVTSATMPAESGVILACYDSGGNVKIVGAFPCPKGYTPLQWNQQGPKGDPGPQG